MSKYLSAILCVLVIICVGCQKNSPKEINSLLSERPFHLVGELTWQGRVYDAELKRTEDQILTVTMTSENLTTPITFTTNSDSSSITQKEYYLTEGPSPAAQSIALLIKQALFTLSNAEIIHADTHIILSNGGYSAKIGTQNQEILEIALPYGIFLTKTTKLI